MAFWWATHQSRRGKKLALTIHPSWDVFLLVPVFVLVPSLTPMGESEDTRWTTTIEKLPIVGGLIRRFYLPQVAWLRCVFFLLWRSFQGSIRGNRSSNACRFVSGARTNRVGNRAQRQENTEECFFRGLTLGHRVWVI